MHVFDDDELGESAMGHFLTHQSPRNDAGHIATGFEAGVGQGAHDADSGAAVHKTKAAFGQQTA